VIEALRQATGGQLDLPTGTIYPALHRLEQRGLTGEQPARAALAACVSGCRIIATLHSLPAMMSAAV
jgi:hypothetical protein